MGPFIHELANDKRMIAILMAIASLLFVINVIQGIVNYRLSTNFTIYIPPSMQSSALVTVNEVPVEQVYSFAFFIFQILNHWPTDGVQDFQHNIDVYASYFTPAYREQLNLEYHDWRDLGQLQNRVRKMVGQKGAAFEYEHVTKLSDGSWEVLLDVQLMEYDNHGVLVKDLDVRYALHIVSFDIDRIANPWGLAIAGFTQAPVRLADHLGGDL